MLRVVLVGRPNVGKSALLNRLVRRTVSIVHDQPGVTRDRISAIAHYKERPFEIVDTGGIGVFNELVTPKEIAQAVRMQADIAMESADVILVVADGLEGLNPLDEEIVKKLRKEGKKPWLLVNKLDTPKHEARAAEFFRMGVDPTFLVSASQSRGISELWEALFKKDQEEASQAPTPETGSRPRIAIVGRPNVGKSSLVNRLSGAERVIVSAVPGTTRDSVELTVEHKDHGYFLIDTAGVRSKSKIHDNVEMYSRHGTEKSVARSDVAILMINAPDGATRQDLEIARMILDYNKPCLILVNKWDLNEKLETEHTSKDGKMKLRRVKRRTVSSSEYETELRYQMRFLDYAPVKFVSALQGYHAMAIWKEIDRINQARKYLFSTGELNRILKRAQDRSQPTIQKGKRLKIYYATQKQNADVPTFILFVNQRNLWVDSYGRYLEHQLREEHSLPGCPIVFHLRAKGEKEEEFEDLGKRQPNHPR